MYDNKIYVNKKVKLDTAYLMTDDDVMAMLNLLVGEVDGVVGETTGSSACGPYEEGDIDYVVNGKERTLCYDFIEVENEMAEVFRYWIERPESEMLDSKKNMTDKWFRAHDRMGRLTGLVQECRCPVCQSREIEFVATDLETPYRVYLDYTCGMCQSKFSAQYGFEGILVQKDGRFEDD